MRRELIEERVKLKLSSTHCSLKTAVLSIANAMPESRPWLASLAIFANLRKSLNIPVLDPYRNQKDSAVID
jgi:hypothetical protein